MKGDHTDHKIKTEPRRHTLTKIQDNLEKREQPFGAMEDHQPEQGFLIWNQRDRNE